MACVLRHIRHGHGRHAALRVVGQAGRRQMCDVRGGERERKPKGYWGKAENQRAFLDELAEGRGFDAGTAAGWADVTVRDVRAAGGRSLLAQYGDSLSRLLSAVYPDTDFSPCGWSGQRMRVERGHWEKQENRRAFMDRLAEAKGVRSAEDWRQVSADDVKAAGGSRLLHYAKGSMLGLLRDCYPEEEMEELLCRPRVPNGFWQEAANRKAFLQGIAEEMGVKEPQQWRQVTAQDVQRLGGSRLLHAYGGSLHRLLRDTFPELREKDSSFYRPKASQNHWAEQANQRQLLDAVAEAKGVQCAADWQAVTTQDILDAGGSGLLNRYPTVLTCLQEVYGGSYRGEPLTALAARRVLPTKHWEEEENVVEFMRHAEKELGIASPQEWLRVSFDQIISLGGRGLLASRNLAEALRLLHPKVTWKEDDFMHSSSRAKKSTQQQLRVRVQQIFAQAGGSDAERVTASA